MIENKLMSETDHALQLFSYVQESCSTSFSASARSDFGVVCQQPETLIKTFDIAGVFDTVSRTFSNFKGIDTL
jgi:hypothetical protein